MKIAFLAHKLFDQRAGAALCTAFRDLGHHAAVVDRCEQNFDVVIEACHARSEATPKDAVHIAWVQEYYAGGSDPDYDDCFDRDLIYTFGKPEIISCPRFKHWRGSLCMAVEPQLLDRPMVEPTLDFSIAGFIGAPAWFKKQSELPAKLEPGHGYNIMAELMDLIVRETRVKPLTGSFDQAAEFAYFKDILAKYLNDSWFVPPKVRPSLYGVAAQNIHETARTLNRYTVAKLILQVSKNIEFRGLHWDCWPELADYAKPFTDDREGLFDLYQRSRINVHDNIFGFAMHSRVLEAMAVGGFIMANESPHYGAAGQMTETFEPGIHFGQYNAQTFVPEAQYWLKADRSKPVAKARKIIATRHLWKHRAEQILGDL